MACRLDALNKEIHRTLVEVDKTVRNKISVCILILALLIAATACAKKENPAPAGQETRMQAVSVVKADRVSLSAALTSSGKISPVEEVKVVPKTPGKVARVLGEVGQTVAAGTLLLELDNADIQAKLEASRAALAVSDANLERAGVQLEKSQIQLEDAKKNLDRKKILFDAKAISLSDYETAKSSFDSAKKDVDMNAASLASSQAGVEQSRAAIRQNEVELESSMVYSPISGTITSRSVNAGEYVSNNNAAMVVVNIDTVEVDASLMEDEINYVKEGQEVKVSVAAVSPEPFKGRVTKISISADQKSKTYPFKVAIDNQDRLLKPDMFAEIRMEVVKREGVLAVPDEAVLEKNGQKVVYQAQGDKSVERKVKTGVSSGGKTEITDGLSGGEMIIVSGLTSMKDGLDIKVQGSQPGQGASKTQGDEQKQGTSQSKGSPGQGTPQGQGAAPK